MAKNNKEKTSAAKQMAFERQNMIGPKMSFAAAEAYKLLRTNVMFSFSDANDCHILGVTSSFRGEGKSLTAINLAYTYAETGKAVLLIEGDMRLPTMAGRLAITAKPGLSNLLVGTDSVAAAIQEYNVRDGDRDFAFDVVSGSIPPNPSELLGSDRMLSFLKKAKERYDAIIVGVRGDHGMEVLDILSSESALKRWRDCMREGIRTANSVIQIFIMLNKPY